MRAESAQTWHRVARVAGRQHGVVTRQQLRAAGLSDSAVGRRCAAGQLQRLHRGVYAVGHRAIPIEGWWLAAVLACGEGAALSHRSAAGLWRLLDPVLAPVHVSVPGRAGRRPRGGVRIHRPQSLEATAVIVHNQVPVTTPPRTIHDLRGSVSAAELRRAIRQAEVRGLPTGLAPAAPTRSELEDLFLRLCGAHSLPTPQVNVRVAGLEVDFLWPRQRLIVETDGYRYHRGHAAFEGDHERDPSNAGLGGVGYPSERLVLFRRQRTRTPSGDPRKS